ncbi:hypothetical protein C9374_007365 [Naegleria lovaniensis]|uniref:RWP-RK domain-containing protein n=1 Tax=Naegleria lovaniensis TaxID=51637 RepID=A0AA88KIH6_NAELO|nr:uncharacterized protein C9374_007365 [Naegleria lovaniensis]KAG2379226.1 hypothetical protein C9374_007365 [Naegleria lovaniensis]
MPKETSNNHSKSHAHSHSNSLVRSSNSSNHSSSSRDMNEFKPSNVIMDTLSTTLNSQSQHESCRMHSNINNNNTHTVIQVSSMPSSSSSIRCNNMSSPHSPPKTYSGGSVVAASSSHAGDVDGQHMRSNNNNSSSNSITNHMHHPQQQHDTTTSTWSSLSPPLQHVNPHTTTTTTTSGGKTKKKINTKKSSAIKFQIENPSDPNYKSITQKSNYKEITLEEMSQYFHLPQTQAAELLGVSLSTLKVSCFSQDLIEMTHCCVLKQQRRFYSFGIGRWPSYENNNNNNQTVSQNNNHNALTCNTNNNNNTGRGTSSISPPFQPSTPPSHSSHPSTPCIGNAQHAQHENILHSSHVQRPNIPNDDSRDSFYYNINNNHAAFHSSASNLASLRNFTSPPNPVLSNSSSVGTSIPQRSNLNRTMISLQQQPTHSSQPHFPSTAAVHSHHLRASIPPSSMTTPYDSTRSCPSILENSSMSSSQAFLGSSQNNQRISRSTPSSTQLTEQIISYSTDNLNTNTQNGLIGNYHAISQYSTQPNEHQDLQIRPIRSKFNDHSDALPPINPIGSSNNKQQLQGNSQSYRYHPYQRVQSPQQQPSLITNEQFIQQTNLSDMRNVSSSYQHEQRHYHQY